MSKQVINLQKLYEQMLGIKESNLQMTPEIIVPKIGKTYLPPMSLNLENTIKPKTTKSTNQPPINTYNYQFKRFC